MLGWGNWPTFSSQDRLGFPFHQRLSGWRISLYACVCVLQTFLKNTRVWVRERKRSVVKGKRELRVCRLLFERCRRESETWKLNLHVAKSSLPSVIKRHAHCEMFAKQKTVLQEQYWDMFLEYGEFFGHRHFLLILASLILEDKTKHSDVIS